MSYFFRLRLSLQLFGRRITYTGKSAPYECYGGLINLLFGID